jgi:hypothetical protein
MAEAAARIDGDGLINRMHMPYRLERALHIAPVSARRAGFRSHHRA